MSGSEGMPLMLLNTTIVSLSENEFRLRSTFWQIIHLFPFEVRFWVNVILFSGSITDAPTRTTWSALPQSKSSRRTPAILHCFLSLTSTSTPAAPAQIPWEAREILLRHRRRGRRYQSASARTQPMSSPHSWQPRRRILSEPINNQRGAPMQASFSGQPHRHLQVTVRLRLRLTVFQEEAFHPAAGVLCLGHCCRLVSPDASSTSISYDAVHGRRLYMLGGSLVPVWSVKCWEATLLSRAWTTRTQPTDRSPYRYYSHVAYFFTFMFKPRFCAWMMWRMILEFLLFDSTWYWEGLLR